MQQTGEIHRNPSTSESSTPNGCCWAGSLPREVSFNMLQPSITVAESHHWSMLWQDHQSSVKQIATCQASKLVKPGDMQSNTPDIYLSRWKKWIRESVGRLRQGSPLACGMKNSVKHLAEKNCQGLHGPIQTQKPQLMSYTQVFIARFSNVCPPFMYLTADFRLRFRPDKAQHKFHVSVVSSAELRLADSHGMSWQAVSWFTPGTRLSSLRSLFKKTCFATSRAEPKKQFSSRTAEQFLRDTHNKMQTYNTIFHELQRWHIRYIAYSRQVRTATVRPYVIFAYTHTILNCTCVCLSLFHYGRHGLLTISRHFYSMA